jgi:uncharacterized alpha-E superfamily protein
MMPIINLTPTERLISTPRSWEWQYLKLRKDRLTGEPSESWEFFRNYTSLESALTDVVNVRIRTSKHQDIGEAIQEVKDSMASVSKAITQSLVNDVQAINEEIKKGDVSHGTKS